ncbi:Excinuclease ABC subunit C [Acetitomaculum ruminis DSM 5522]|uniref:UvrABC system protein C n=1 Tax=Acetitomaculum ruminis DSM 5522 TaxID=1120918 RepID=A0A1I0XYW7_9FIRM|nr:excinuclease ABC subunit UvrC [Acetitomaculum ruminis]SFB06225.1 Excinuclease ABC subunit C [Acetitomaculum ruminis DSM 5522]
MFNIELELKKLPSKPGVYIMHDSKDAIIYVGKAVNLTNRVHQYFQKGYKKSPKIEQMVSKIKRFEYIVTDSELEALVLECNLIKEHRPKYNTMLKDDKTYPYIKVTVKDDFPLVVLSRKMKKDGSKYYGPYTSAAAVKDTIELIRKLYKIRSCNKSLPKDIGKSRPCLNYHIGQCDAPCIGRISKEEYAKKIEKALDFLNGEHGEIIKSLEEKMYEASERLEFEKAMEYKELLNSVKFIAQKQRISNQDLDDKDVVAMACDDRDAVVQVFFIRSGKVIGREHFFVKINADEGKETILNTFVKQFYSGTPYIPKELILQYEIEDREVIEKWLENRRKSKVYIKVPKKGMKEKLVSLAQENAKMVLYNDKERIKREEGRTIGAMKDIASRLSLEGIKRVEAFDISHISGFETVASMVVFENGKPMKNDYRRFKIQNVTNDDYASMEEVLNRRFSHGIEEMKELEEKKLGKEVGSFTRFPDLIMMDGGKGQVNVALKVLEDLKMDIPVCGMVKDDHHNTRGLLFKNEEIPLEKNTEAFKLITRIQDEAHRFAIEYHRFLRSKEQVHSILDDIKGIGPTRRKALLRHFKSTDEIAKASLEEIEATDSMDAKSAKAVYEFFRNKIENN